MNLFLFFGLILIISHVGRSSILKTNTNVEDGNKEETSFFLQIAGRQMILNFDANCICGKGESASDTYIVGEILYYADARDKSNITKRRVFIHRKENPIQNDYNPTFMDFARVTDETDDRKIGAYIEIWDEDGVSDDFLGSWNFRRGSSVSKAINAKKHSSKINKYDNSPEFEKCPENSGTTFSDCGIGQGDFSTTDF